MKKLNPILIPAILLASCSPILPGTSNNDSITSTSFELSGSVVDSVEPDESMFNSSYDIDPNTIESPVEIVLDGSSATISDSSYGTLSDNRMLLKEPGYYHVTGSSSNVILLVNKSSKGDFYLILDNVTMTNDSNACIFVYDATTTIINLVGTNNLTSSNSDEATYGTTTNIDGVIHAKDDLVINGSGTLNVTHNYLHGIVAKDSLTIQGGTINVTATKKGIDVNDSLAIKEAEISITSGTDGIQVENDDATSYFYMESGTLDITSGQDGIQVSMDDDATDDFSGALKIIGGSVNITAGGGSSNSKDDDTSQKGIKCEGDLILAVATFNINSADDCIHSNGSISLVSGTYNLSSGDDGVHADSTLLVSGGTINITKCYEGLEGYIVQIDGGTIDIVASDDGINAYGGSDTTKPGGNSWGHSTSSSSSSSSSTLSPTITINDGYITIVAGGDGVDSNGSIYVNGGTIIAESSGNDDFGFDYEDTSGYEALITGGLVFASGSSSMAVNFSGGSQCSALISLSGSKNSSISIDDGSEFTWTSNISFSAVLYSSSYMSVGSTYTMKAGNNSTSFKFSSYLYNGLSGGNQPGGNTGGGSPGGR